MLLTLDEYKEVGYNSFQLSAISDMLSADLRLSVPTLKGFTPDRATRRQIAKFFPILVTGQQRNRIKIKDFEKILPVSMARWNKLHILNGGDQIRCLDTVSELSALGKRDNSFVRVGYILSCFSLKLTGHLVYPFPRPKPTGPCPAR